jgi:transposase-like protein
MAPLANNVVLTKKRCHKCRKTKPVKEFLKNPKNKAGYSGKCKECNKEDQKSKKQKEGGLTGNQKRMLVALEQTLGIITPALKIAGLSYNAHYQWLKKSGLYKKEFDKIKEIQLDFVESKLLKNIKEGDTTAMIFYLKTKGKDRGYSEKIDLNITEKKEDVILYLPDNQRGVIDAEIVPKELKNKNKK